MPENPPVYFTRITWNDNNWTRPSTHEGENSYVGENGFGHEEWLNRSEWTDNGWRYAFIQGVHKSQSRLAGESIRLLFFSIRPLDMARLYVGELQAAHVLTDEQVDQAGRTFRARGWLKAMRQEVKDVGGNPTGLDLDLANVRFRPEALKLYESPILARADDQIQRVSRYQLVSATTSIVTQWTTRTKKIAVQNPDWSNDEHILALDVYMAAKPGQVQKGSPEIRELSQLLLRLHTKLGTRGAATLRNEDGVYMKLGNFKRHDPEFTSAGRKGLSRGSKGEETVWNEFSSHLALLRETAASIRAAILSDVALADVAEDPTLSGEGRVLTRLHRVFERSLENRNKKLAAFKKAHGGVFCECCGFDFGKTYGVRGAGYIEVHHQVPVWTLKGAKPKIEDLRLLCSNCHRMVHVREPWLSMHQLRALRLVD